MQTMSKTGDDAKLAAWCQSVSLVPGAVSIHPLTWSARLRKICKDA